MASMADNFTEKEYLAIIEDIYRNGSLKNFFDSTYSLVVPYEDNPFLKPENSAYNKNLKQSDKIKCQVTFTSCYMEKKINPFLHIATYNFNNTNESVKEVYQIKKDIAKQIYRVMFDFGDADHKIKMIVCIVTNAFSDPIVIPLSEVKDVTW